MVYDLKQPTQMSNAAEFSNKVVLITGSSGGLGAHTAREFDRRSANVVVTGRRAEAVEKVAEECRSLSPGNREMLSVVGDVTKQKDLQRLIDTTIQKFGQLDVLVNNAGAGAFSSIYDPNLISTLEHMHSLDVMSVIALTQLAVPHLETTKGAIVNISSVCGQQPSVQFIPCCMAKAATDIFAKCIALELGPKGIRINAISLTAMRTNFQAATGVGSDLEQHLVHLSGAIPLRRLTTVQDVSDAILFPASSKASFINAANLAVDGGDLVR